VFVEVDRKILEHEAAIVKRQFAQVGAADLFRVVENGFEVEPIARD
jgi:hypothetical protein